MNHSVIELINQRKKSESKPGQRKDNYKLGLAVEGGGMRGLVGTSMSAALHYLGLVDVFDAFYGSSAGALTGTFFVGRQMPLGPSIFYENINNNKFIDLKRLVFSKKPIMDLDFLIYQVLINEKPMNWEGVIKSTIPLNIIVSSINQRKAIVYNHFASKEELFILLKASASIPFIAGKPVEYKGDLLFDASIYESIPYKSAIQDGCTHVLCLLTRPDGILRGKPSFMEKNLIAPFMKKIKAGLEEDFLRRSADYKETIDFLKAKNQSNAQGPFIYSISLPQSEPEVGRLERNKEKLIAGAKAGMKAVMLTFLNSGNEIKYHQVLYPVNKIGLLPNILES